MMVLLEFTLSAFAWAGVVLFQVIVYCTYCRRCRCFPKSATTTGSRRILRHTHNKQHRSSSSSSSSSCSNMLEVGNSCTATSTSDGRSEPQQEQQQQQPPQQKNPLLLVVHDPKDGQNPEEEQQRNSPVSTAISTTKTTATTTSKSLSSDGDEKLRVSFLSSHLELEENNHEIMKESGEYLQHVVAAASSIDGRIFPDYNVLFLDPDDNDDDDRDSVGIIRYDDDDDDDMMASDDLVKHSDSLDGDEPPVFFELLSQTGCEMMRNVSIESIVLEQIQEEERSILHFYSQHEEVAHRQLEWPLRALISA